MRSFGLLLLASAVAFGQRTGAFGTGGGMRTGGGGARIGSARSNVVLANPAFNTNSGFNTNSYASPNGFGSITGFGNVVFPGTGHSPVPFNNFNTVNPNTFYPNIGLGRRFGGSGFGGSGAVVYVPYGGGYNGGYYGGVDPSLNGGYPAQQQPTAPQVVINQSFVSDTARPVVREYGPDPTGGIRVYPPLQPQPQPSADTQATASDENPTYLIAFKDHTIYAAVGYWVDGDTLHYVTNHNTHNQVSLDLVDRDLSSRLNQERQVDFRLPPPTH